MKQLEEHKVVGNPWEPGYKARFPWGGLGALLLVVGCTSNLPFTSAYVYFVKRRVSLI